LDYSHGIFWLNLTGTISQISKNPSPIDCSLLSQVTKFIGGSLDEGMVKNFSSSPWLIFAL
jgi:hypothetical protein